MWQPPDLDEDEKPQLVRNSSDVIKQLEDARRVLDP